MKKPVKLLLFGGLGLVVVLGVGVMLSGSLIGKAVTTAVNKIGPRVTGTTVTLDSAFISILGGKGSLSGLTVGNPEGWSDRNLAKLGNIHLDVAPLSLMGDTIVVEDIVIEGPEFSYETKIISSNVKELLEAIEQATGGPKPEEEAAPEDEAAAGEKLIAVKRFILRDGKVTIGAGASSVTVPLPDLELNDLGSPEKGLTSRQLILAVSREITADIIVAATGALKTMGTTSGASAADGVKKVGDSIKGLFGGGD